MLGKDYAKEVETNLKNRGLNVRLDISERNGQEIYGITLVKPGVGAASPTSYLNPMEGLSVEEAADSIYNILKNAPEYDVDVQKMTSLEYVKENIFLGIERKNDSKRYNTRDSIIPDVSEYLYVKTPDGAGSYKMNDALLKQLGVSIDEMFEIGKKNTCDATKVLTMKEMLINMGVPAFAIPDEGLMFVVTQDNPSKGAAASVLCEEKIAELADKTGTTDFVLLPSSIYEVILVPDLHDGTDLSETLTMVGAVNEQCVDPLEQLGDKPFHLSIDGKIMVEPLEDYLERNQSIDLD